MKIIFLDIKTLGNDLDLSGYDDVGQVITYDFSLPCQIPERVMDADVIITNKPPINKETIYTAAHLKLVCVTGTGTNHLDKDYLAAHQIAWRNVSAYSTESVAQHTFGMLFYLLEKLRYYDDYVKDGHYIKDTRFTHFTESFHELSGKTWGIIGLGNIGKRVADIAEQFGANVIYYSTSGNNDQPGYKRADWSTLLSCSDIISVHAPLNADTKHLINQAAFSSMRSHAIFLNLGRGAIVEEEALADALLTGQIAAAGLDVLCEEPMREHHPLSTIQDSRKLLITPHIGWASIESRTRLMRIILEQIKEFFHTNNH